MTNIGLKSNSKPIQSNCLRPSFSPPAIVPLTVFSHFTRHQGWEWHVYRRSWSWRWCLHHTVNPFGIKKRNAIFLSARNEWERSFAFFPIFAVALISRWRIFLPLVNIDPWLKRSEFRITFLSPPVFIPFSQTFSIQERLQSQLLEFKIESPALSLLFNFLPQSIHVPRYLLLE